MKLYRIKPKQDSDWLYVAAKNLVELANGYQDAFCIEKVSDKVIIYRESN